MFWWNVEKGCSCTRCQNNEILDFDFTSRIIDPKESTTKWMSCTSFCVNSWAVQGCFPGSRDFWWTQIQIDSKTNLKTLFTLQCKMAWPHYSNSSSLFLVPKYQIPRHTFQTRQYRVHTGPWCIELWIERTRDTRFIEIITCQNFRKRTK